ncbi:MAG: ABC transporter permease [Firmicutes bacterium]|nr:ABC transporter permease [Bacillota bacterium]
MAKYVVKRLLLMIPMMFMVILIIFLIMSLTPGDPANINLPITTPKNVKEAYNISVGFTGPLYNRFYLYLKGLLKGEVLSYSTRENIFTEIWVRLPNTVRLGLPVYILESILGVSLGILCAIKQYSIIDAGISVLAVFLGSVPAFLIGTLGLFIFAARLGWLPSFGLDQGVKSLILPVAALTITGIPFLIRLTRSAMLSVMSQDYVRTARAKGCSERTVIWKHVFKNASLPIITILITALSGIVGGAVLTEEIFSLPGLGTYMMAASKGKNVPVVMTCSLLLAGLFMLNMTLLDIVYGLIDPKVRQRYR